MLSLDLNQKDLEEVDIKEEMPLCPDEGSSLLLAKKKSVRDGLMNASLFVLYFLSFIVCIT